MELAIVLLSGFAIWLVAYGLIMAHERAVLSLAEKLDANRSTPSPLNQRGL